MMTRRVPWVLGDVSRAEVVDAVVRRGERLPMPEGIDPKLAAALESAWAPRPADRPSAAAIADALRAAGAEGWGEEGAFAAAAPIADARGREVVAALGEEARAEDEERGGPSRRRTPRATRSPRARARLKRARARPTPRPPRRKKRLLLRRERAWDLPTGRRRATSNGATERRPRTTTRSKPPPRGLRDLRASRRVDALGSLGLVRRRGLGPRRGGARRGPRLGALPARLRLRVGRGGAEEGARGEALGVRGAGAQGGGAEASEQDGPLRGVHGGRQGEGGEEAKAGGGARNRGERGERLEGDEGGPREGSEKGGEGTRGGEEEVPRRQSRKRRVKKTNLRARSSVGERIERVNER